MKSTKAKILATAKACFNDLGYSNVTIRMLASALEISSGHLNYHFKTREDILEALYFEMVEEFDNRIGQLGQQEITFQTIRHDIYHSLQRMLAYRFIWTDLYNLLRLNEAIKKHFESVYAKRFGGYEFLFDHLSSKGLLRDFESAAERQYLIERMIAFSNTWLYNSIIYDREIDEAYMLQQSHHLMAMLYPYLTAMGKADFKKSLA